MKKLLAVVLSLVMVMTMFSGCESDSASKNGSTFFKELNKASDIKTGTVSFEFGFEAKMEEDVPEYMLDGDKVKVGVKMDVVSEATDKVAAKVSAKVGADSDYSEVTTLALADNVMYLDVEPIVNFIKKYDEETATSLETTLGQIGATKAVKIDVKQLMSAMGSEMPDTKNIEKDAQKFSNDAIKALEKDFDKLQGVDGDDYTLTIGKSNAKEAADAIVKFVENDLETLINGYFDLMKKAYGDDSALAAQFDQMKEQFDIEEIKTEVKDNKDKMVESLEDLKGDIVVKLNTSGDKGSRDVKISLDTDTIEIEDTEGKLIVNAEIKEGKDSVADMIPEDAVDLTAMLTGAMNGGF